MPTPNIVPPSCPGASDGLVELTVTGGAPYPGGLYNYDGDFNGTPTAMLSDDSPLVGFDWEKEDSLFTYVVEIRDANNCFFTDTLEIPVVNTIDVVDSLMLPACAGELALHLLTVLGGERWQFQLFNEDTNMSVPNTFSIGSTIGGASDLEPGNYRWVYTQSPDPTCRDEFTFTVPETPLTPIVIDSSANVAALCGMDNGSVDISVSGGISPYAIDWDDANLTGFQINNLPAAVYPYVITDDNGCEVMDSVDLRDSNFIIVEPFVVIEFDCGDPLSEGTLSSGVTSSLSDITYEWTDNLGTNVGSTESINVPNGGIYDVVVTSSGSGCSETAQVEISKVTIDYSFEIVNPNDCSGTRGSIAIVIDTVGTDISWVWLSPINPFINTDSLVRNLAADSYPVRIFSNRCTIEDTVVLVTKSNVSYDTLITLPTCTGDMDGIIQLVGTDLTCEWAHDNTITDCFASNLAAGTYDIKVVDDLGCESNETIILEDPELVAIDTISLQAATCHDGTNGTATIEVINNPLNNTDFQYYWNNDAPVPGDDMAMNMALSPGANSVFVQDSLCFSDTLFFDITAPDTLRMDMSMISPAACSGMCNGIADLVSLGGNGGYSYEWDDGSSDASRTDLCAGKFLITVTDAEGCMTIDSIVVVESDSIFLEVSNVMGFGCDGSGVSASITVEANGGCDQFSYDWGTANDTTAMLENIINPGNYVVTVTDGCGCTQTISQEIETASPIFAIATTPIPPVCAGGQTCIGIDPLSVTGGSGFNYTYAINNGNNLPIDSCIMAPAGNYTLTVFDSDGINGCPFVIDLQVPDADLFSANLGPDIDLDIADAQSILHADITSSADITNIEWISAESFECLNTLCDSIQLAVTNNASYQVIITDINDCTTRDEVNINFSSPRRVYFPTIFDPNSIQDDRFMVMTGTGVETIIDFIIFDRWGNQVFELPEAFKAHPTSKDDGWNGRASDGQLYQQGVYVWIANVRFLDGMVISYNGEINLFR